MLTGIEDAQMSSRYRGLVTRPASHALPSATEAPVCLQKRSTNACLTSGAMREASPHTNTGASFCKRSHTASPFTAIACCTYVFGLPGSREKAHTSFVTPPASKARRVSRSAPFPPRKSPRPLRTSMPKICGCISSLKPPTRRNSGSSIPSMTVTPASVLRRASIQGPLRDRERRGRSGGRTR